MEKNQKEKRIKTGYMVLGVAALTTIITYFFFERNMVLTNWNPFVSSFIVITILAAILLIFDFNNIVFDNEEYKPNKTIPEIVQKIRYRGILFNNIATIIFIFTLLVIFVSFYFLVHPQVGSSGNDLAVSLTIRIGSSVLLIFLVQILFKVFKYLLRVAAFYNARADAIEFRSMDSKIELDKLMDMFTPDKYDISELEQMSLFDSIQNAAKGKEHKF